MTTDPGRAAAIERTLREALAPLRLTVADDSAQHAGHAGAREGGHYTVRITSARFAGVPRLARHRLVYDALGPLGPLGIHALAIVALAPDEAAADAATPPRR
jgi:BolA family transcriptional regulator, general stress-responsive regulator